MFGSLRRENARLHRRIDNLAERVQTETKLRETAIGNQARMARQFTAQHDELTRLRAERGDADRLRLAWTSARRRATEAQQDTAASRRIRRYLSRACARYRGEIADRDRLILDQQKTLDCLLGLDSAAVEAGADWQDRRTDRPGGVR